MPRSKARRKNGKNGVKDPALQHAIAIVGGEAALAQILGVTTQAICKWHRCPPRRVIAVERATGGVVRRERLCPEVFAE